MRFVRIYSQQLTPCLRRGQDFQLSKRIIFALCFLLLASNAAISDEIAPLHIGNFSLPSSQQPGAFYSFGSNIIKKGQCQIAFTPDIFKSTGERYIEYSTNILYGTTEKSSLLLIIPSELEYKNKNNNLHYYGFGDITLQGEYAFYDQASYIDTKQIAGIFGITVPSGAQKIGYQRAAYFIGSTINYVAQEWLSYLSPGVLLFAGSEKIRPGTQWYVDLGVGKNITSKANQHIALALLEINAQYNATSPSDKFTPRTKQSGNVVTDGYLFYLSPSLFYSTPSMIYQVGFSVPIVQHWANTSNVVDYYVACNLTWTLNKTT